MTLPYGLAVLNLTGAGLSGSLLTVFEVLCDVSDLAPVVWPGIG
jgi:hypothetical protein